MADVNRSQVEVTLKDVHRQAITDSVELKFYNRRAQSLNQRFRVQLQGGPALVGNVPAFPFGLAEVFITPTIYRYKSIFVDVPSGEPGHIDQTFFVEPARVRPEFPDISTGERWAELRRILTGFTPGWNGLGDRRKAGLLNLYAKMQEQSLNGTQKVVQFVESLHEVRPARVHVFVNRQLLELVESNPASFHRVDGSLHEFPSPEWKLVASFKTFEAAGNLQVTFASNGAGKFMADIDIDDHQGVEHAADVLKHKITGKDTHPYDIHQILIYFQNLDPGYQFLPAARARKAVA